MTSLKRILRGGALGASLALTAGAQSVSMEAAQNVRLTELSRKLATHNQDSRVPGVGERLGAAMDQTRGRLDWLASRLEQGDTSVDVAGALSEERKKLAVLNEAYETEFGNVEAKLRRAGLPPSVLTEKLAIWHAFTANYRERMDATQAGFDQLSRKAAGGNASWLRAQLANLRAGLGVESLQRTDRVSDTDSPRLTPRVVPKATASSPAALADDTPTPDDSAATGIVLLTPDILSKANTAGNSAAALFAYVYDTIQFAPYYGLVQNSESVLWSGKGNDADQATLLIALLRAAKIPARYVMGTISVPVADAISWTGAKDKAGASSFLNLNTTVTDQGTSFGIVHVWVEAWLPNGSKNAWIPMTPSIKRQTFQPGLTLARPAFNRPQFLSMVQTPLASEIYADQLHTAFQKAYPGHDFTELAYTGTITPVSAATLPNFPYPPTQITTRAAAFPGHTIGVTLATSKTKLFSTPVVMPEVSLEAITLSFTAASQHDQSIIDSFGGLANVPVGLVNLLPQLRIDGAVTATGTTPTSNGGLIGLTVAHTESFATSPAGTYSHTITAGENVALTLGLNQISQALIDARVDRIAGELATAPADDVVRDVLALAGWRYFQRSEIEKARVFPPLQIVPTLTNPEECATYASLKVTNLFDRPFLATPAADTVDATAAQIRGLDLNAGGTEALSVPNDLDPSRATEAGSSGLENEL